MPRILIAEDEAVVRSLVSRGLAEDGHQIYEAATGRECLHSVHHHQPDLLVLDIEMPAPDGLEVCSRLRADDLLESLPILFMTGRKAPSEVVNALEGGGDDYVTKPFEMEILRARVMALLRRAGIGTSRDDGEAEGDEGIVRRGPFDLNRRERRLHVGDKDKEVELTPTEMSLFHFLLRNAGEVYSSEELLQMVWDYPYGVGEKATVRVYVKHLREKIEPEPSSPQWLVTRTGHGYTLDISDSD